MTEKEVEYQDAVKDICDKPRDYLERWVLDHLKEFHRVDALNKELRTRVAELTNHEEQTHKDLGEILGTDDSLKNCALRLQTRLSTLLKASEGMERALGMVMENIYEDEIGPRTLSKVKASLADFRAVKEGL